MGLLRDIRSLFRREKEAERWLENARTTDDALAPARGRQMAVSVGRGLGRGRPVRQPSSSRRAIPLQTASLTFSSATEQPGAALLTTAFKLPEKAIRMVAGATAGAMSKFASAPLEAVRLQTMSTGSPVFQVARSIFTRGGIPAFFAGVEADVLKTVPSKAIELVAHDAAKKLLQRLTSKPGERGSPGPLLLMAAGALAGVTTTVLLSPFDTLRTRMAHSGASYSSLAHAARSTVAEGGMGALYKGLPASVVGAIPYSAIRLGSYDLMKIAYLKAAGKEAPPQALALIGAAAAIAAVTATFPLEVIRRRAMVGKAISPNPVAAIAGLAASEGLGALYKGIVITLAKTAPQNAVQMMAYDLLLRKLAGSSQGAPRSHDR